MYIRSEVEKNAVEYFKDELAAKVWVDKYALRANSTDFLEKNPEETIQRITKELTKIERVYPNPRGEQEIYNLLKGYHKFVFGGSILYGVGNFFNLSTTANCYVVDSPEDSIGGIWKTDQELAEIMKNRGGVGVDISTIRPLGSIVNNASSSSTGIKSWMEQFSNTTRRIAQAGRRGALMITLNVNHPDILSFITAKDNLNDITGANISVKITDDFMKALHTNSDFELSFKGTKNIVKAKVIWDLIIHQAWKNAEPGLLFWNRILENSPADCYEGFNTISVNPCSELSLCPFDSCRLGSINIFAYVKHPFTSDAYFDYYQFEDDVFLSQRLMDDIIEIEKGKIMSILAKIANNPESEETKRIEKSLWNKIYDKLHSGRRTGLGVMGLADAGAALNLKYASDEFNTFAQKVIKDFSLWAYISSIELAKERGAFPIFSRKKEENNLFIKRIVSQFSNEELKDYYKYGRRNIANLAIAPTGSISMLSKTSSGIEPVFALSYKRRRKVEETNPNKKFKDETGDWWEEYTVNHHNAELWSKESKEVRGIKENPYIEAHKVDPISKLKLQALLQPWIDHSISVTYNLSKDTTETVISDLYTKAWEYGLKGITVYRDGSRNSILFVDKKTDGIERPQDLKCDAYNIMAKGRPWKIFIGLMNDTPYEVFAVNGSMDKVPIDKGILRKVRGGRYDFLSPEGEVVIENITTNMTPEEEALTRTISWALRNKAELEFGISQLDKSKGDVASFSKAISRILKKYLKNKDISDICPECNSTLTREGGCIICNNCGYSKCN